MEVRTRTSRLGLVAASLAIVAATFPLAVLAVGSPVQDPVIMPVTACLASNPTVITALIGGVRVGNNGNLLWEGTTRFGFNCSTGQTSKCFLCITMTSQMGHNTTSGLVWEDRPSNITSTGVQNCSTSGNTSTIDMTIDPVIGSYSYRIYIYAKPYNGTTPCEQANIQGATVTNTQFSVNN